ncbi:octanoyl-[acyl-carrier-protein]:protein N-octanoyltransferase LIPT2, mitochondrial isoform X2 [Salmo trutta]|uniref:octanoyl-[acyl-carrier-protein]:protein N-octanoyltransferase LIPT2, mitochondrial isoform X2 n=1 Tax=Salmo trutta TaxID=8032 RepID=UPI001131751F|nr:putative lipoyltransferase 2, mitochondrial isoform X2 [Salmo trutta]
MYPSKAAVEVIQLGRISYGRALQVQQLYVRRHLDSKDKLHNALLLCEHPPVYTIGIRQALYPFEEEQRLKLLGAEFFRSNRGGLITFHGPGQLVCYPILNLGCFKKSVRWYVCELERTVIDLCRKYGIKASTSPNTGVWVGDNKICAIGKGVTSLSQELGRDVSIEESIPRLLETFSDQFDCTLHHGEYSNNESTLLESMDQSSDRGPIAG